MTHLWSGIKPAYLKSLHYEEVRPGGHPPSVEDWAQHFAGFNDEYVRALNDSHQGTGWLRVMFVGGEIVAERVEPKAWFTNTDGAWYSGSNSYNWSLTPGTFTPGPPRTTVIHDAVQQFLDRRVN